MSKRRPRNWHRRSYKRDGGKEQPIPKWAFDILKEQLGEKKTYSRKKPKKKVEEVETIAEPEGETDVD